MEKAFKKVYFFETKCPDCNVQISVPYTVSDFGDAPVIKHCKNCNELYWYTPDDEAYIRPLDQQIARVSCIKCEAALVEALVPTHKNIKCGKGCDEFSLDNNFAGHRIPDSKEMLTIEVYLIYS